MTVLGEAFSPTSLCDQIVRGRKRYGVDTILVSAHDPSSPASAGLRAMRLLRGGGVVAVAVDRSLSAHQPESVLFGRAAPMSMGALRLAMSTGALIVPAYCVDTPTGVHCVGGPVVDHASLDTEQPNQYPCQLHAASRLPGVQLQQPKS